MIVTIHQPEHFPYLGFFQKMKKAELFVILDNVHYRKNYWVNRNWFIDENQNKSFFTVIVESKATHKNINEVMVAPEAMWKRKLLTKLKSRYKYDFSSFYESEKLIDINMKGLEFCREKLNITVPMVYASALGVDGAKSDLLVDILKEVNATRYISGSFGKDYLDLELFKDHGIEVEFFESNVTNYHTILEYIFGYDDLIL
ncbi:MAG: WbqC family protein [Bacteroidales bacterium]|nr:WbqC family protein [Bacteroidales bacterium]